MKLIDLSPLKPKRGQQKADWATRLQAILKHGWKWYQRHQAEDTVLQVLAGVLDNRFTVVRGFRLPGEEEPLPPIVLGPPGVFLLYVWPKAGFFRIREGQWEVMQGSNRRYRPGKPNMVQVIKDLSSSVAAFLEKKTGQPVRVTPLMVFANTGADVDAVRPDVTPLLLDGLKRHALKLAQADAVLTPTDLLNLRDAFRPKPLAATRPKPQRRRKAAAPPKAVRKAERYFNFTPRQWAILGVLAALVLLTLMCSILYVVMTLSAT